MVDRSSAGSPRLRSNTMWALVGEGVQLVVGFVAFFLLVDRLGPVEAGYYGAVLAIATFGVPVASLGSQALLMRDISAGAAFDQVWSRSILTVFSGGCLATAVAIVAQPWLLPEIPVASFALLFFAQAVLFATAEFGLVAAQAHRRLDVGAAIRIVTGVCRLTAVGVFAQQGGSTVAAWSAFAAVAFLTAAVLSLALVRFFFGASPIGAGPTRDSVGRGLPFALGSGSARALDAMDRPMLVRLGPQATDAGVYNIGYRLTQMALTPVAALIRASDADIFAAGAKGRSEAFAVARRMSARAATYAVVAGAALFLLAPVVPRFLGDEWAEAVSVLRYLSLLPLIKALQTFPANALTSSGHQSSRNKLLFLSIIVNGALNLWLIPIHGWRGAAIATIVAEAVMVVSLWVILVRPVADQEPPMRSSRR